MTSIWRALAAMRKSGFRVLVRVPIDRSDEFLAPAAVIHTNGHDEAEG